MFSFAYGQNNTVGPVLWRKSLYELTPLVFQASDVDQGENGRVDLSWSPGERDTVDAIDLHRFPLWL